jgi:hypothetical protein
MRYSLVALASAALFAIGLSISAIAGAPLPDTDTDGIPGEWDNCSDVSNTDQCDSNMDGYGNRCDADLNNDGAIGSPDFNLFKQEYLLAVPPGDPDADLNCDNAVGSPDFNIFKQGFLGAPGPSGLGCAGTIPCEGV